MLSVHNLTLAYGKHVLLDDVTFSLQPGRIVGLVAPNGCGKTTLLRAMADVPGARMRGTIAVDDVPARAQAERRRRVFYAPGEGSLLYAGMTARDHLAMVRDLWGSDRTVDEVADIARIDHFLNKRVRSLSQGMKQQLTLAIAYLTGARYLLLDEPMNALDPTNVAINSSVLRSLAAHGVGIIMSSHILDNVDQVSDAIVFVKDGKLLLYGAEARADRAAGGGAVGGRHFKRGSGVDGLQGAAGAPPRSPRSATASLPRIGKPGERAIDIYRRLYLADGASD